MGGRQDTDIGPLSYYLLGRVARDGRQAVMQRGRGDDEIRLRVGMPGLATSSASNRHLSITFSLTGMSRGDLDGRQRRSGCKVRRRGIGENLDAEARISAALRGSHIAREPSIQPHTNNAT
jgi:hypothetical protein